MLIYNLSHLIMLGSYLHTIQRELEAAPFDWLILAVTYVSWSLQGFKFKVPAQITQNTLFVRGSILGVSDAF